MKFKSKFLNASRAIGLMTVLMAAAPLYALDIPQNLTPPNNEKVARELFAVGYQVYRCSEKADGKGYEWAFVAPEADLYDSAGRRVMGKHYNGPTWEAKDGSKIVGKVLTRAPAPNSQDIPWLLLEVTPSKEKGLFSNIKHVQRVDTSAGSAPVTSCSASNKGQEEKVHYTARYVLYR